MRYTIRQLEYFIAAGESGSITSAADRLRISQPSVSIAITHLERELGIKLFVRHHAQGLSLTASGRNLLDEAKGIVTRAEALYTVASEASGQVRGPLTIGFHATLAAMLAAELTYSFAAAFPAAQLRHVTGDQDQILAALRRAEVDVAITYDLALSDDIAFQALARLPPHAVLGEAHPLARRRSIALRELEKDPLILLDLPHSRDYLMALFLAEQIRPLVTGRSSDWQVVRTTVANGHGYTILNARPRCDYALDGRRLSCVSLEGHHRPMQLGTAVLDDTRRTRIVEAFEAHCRAHISNAYIPGMQAPAPEPIATVA